MDSERKHELETNDLREFMDNFKDFAEKHGNKVLLVLIVVLGSYAGYKYYNQWKNSNIDEAYQQLAVATKYDTLIQVASDHDLVHDEATRRAADIALGEGRAIYIKYPDDVGKDWLNKAAAAYTTLTEKGQTDLYKLIGHEGLAKVSVMLEKWDEAKTHYNKVIELAGDTYTFQADHARAGLDAIEKLKDPVPFSNPAVIAPAPTGTDDKKDDDNPEGGDKPAE